MFTAWQVNFNLSLSSFEPDLRRLRNLIDLSFHSPYTIPPKVMFVSSISVVGRECAPYFLHLPKY